MIQLNFLNDCDRKAEQQRAFWNQARALLKKASVVAGMGLQGLVSGFLVGSSFATLPVALSATVAVGLGSVVAASVIHISTRMSAFI